MAEEIKRPDICENEQRRSVQPPGDTEAIVNDLVSSCTKDDCFNNIDLPPLPSLNALKGIISQARDILFPGYFSENRIDSISFKYHKGAALSKRP